MRIYCFLLLVVLLQCSDAKEEEKIKIVTTTKGKHFTCLFTIHYDGDTCFSKSKVSCIPKTSKSCSSCIPNRRKKNVAMNVKLILKDGTVINIKKLIIKKKKKDNIKGCRATSPTATTPTIVPGTCKVIEGPAKGKPCVFPFVWVRTGKTYNECAYEQSEGDEYYWCSTKVDSSGNHVIGHFGKCDPDTCSIPSESCPAEDGFCVLPNGIDQNSGVIKLDAIDGNTAQKQAKCLSKCVEYPGATGCEVIWNHDNRGCYVHTQVVDRGNGVGNHKCWIISPSKCKGICKVIKGPAKGKPCVFPFVWAQTGKTYNKCAYEPSEGDKYHWCSTKVDANGNHVVNGNHWGKCDPETCSIPTSKCGIENTGTRISGGSVTAKNQYPWMVRFSPSACGGSLITDRHVLTAKHCVDKDPWKMPGAVVKVSVHNQYDSNDYQAVPIKRVVWPDVSDHDIAILILERPVDLNDKTIGIVCLPSDANKDYRGKKAMALGWGWTPDTSSQSRFLQHVELTVTQRETKNWLWTKTRLVNGVPLDVCTGDSGGPLVYKEAGRWTVIATVNDGEPCGSKPHPERDGKWNKVTDHLDWIKRVIKT